MKQLTGERVLGSATVLVGVGAMLHAVQLGFRLNDEDMGVGLFPLIVGGCLVVCGVFHVVSAPGMKRGHQALSGGQFRVLALVFGGLVGYVAAMSLLGYAAATFIFVAYLTRLLGAKGWKAPVLTAAVTAAVFTLVFQLWMQMPLPTGLFDWQEVL